MQFIVVIKNAQKIIIILKINLLILKNYNF